MRNFLWKGAYGVWKRERETFVVQEGVLTGNRIPFNQEKKKKLEEGKLFFSVLLFLLIVAAGFASYFLFNITSGERVSFGGKLSYCVVTNNQYQTGDKVLCPSLVATTCTEQG